MTNQNDPPLLLTPGPLTTSTRVKEAMLRDWGSRDKDFIELTHRIRERLVDIAGAGENYTCVPLQGSGTFVVEAAIDTFIPKEAKTLVLINGAYGRRIAKICALHAKEFVAYETGEDEPPSAGKVEALLENDPSITHVVAVHCETTSGILNPIDEIAAAAYRQKRNLIIDAMSSFGALDFNLSALKCAAVVASSNKCLEGAPGVGFAIVEKDLIRASSGNASSLSLDLHDQWRSRLKLDALHVFLPSDEAIETMAEIGVLATVQDHPVLLGHNQRRWWGDERAAAAIPIRRLIDAGLLVGGGTDGPVVPVDPFLSMWWMVTRQTLLGYELGPDQAISAKEALELYTINNARIMGVEDRRGSIEPGKLADLVILSQDIVEVDPDEIRNTRALMTMVGGKVVHRDGI